MNYKKYKPSGVEWIGEIPEEWEVRKLKWICKFEYGNSLSVNEREEGEVPVFGSNGITGFHLHSITKAPCIVVGRKGSFGKVNWASEKCFPIDTSYFIDEDRTRNNLRWLFYILNLLNLDSFSKDTGVPGLSREDAYLKLLPKPTVLEQTAIANFLDDKTTKIDSLIEKKKKLIELLKEERTAVINQAVTRGINPNVKLKESGIEWLGLIPEHWEVKKLKYVSKVNSESLTEKEDEDLLIHYIDISSVDSDGNIISTTEYLYSDAPSRARRIVKDGDTILSTVRTYLKAIAYIEEANNLICSTGFAVIRPSDVFIPKFLFYIFRSQIIIEKIMASSKGVSYPAIDSEDVKFISIWYASKEEQLQIVHHLETETKRIDSTISKIEKEIELLAEYRTALISEVVTGKIKVINNG